MDRIGVKKAFRRALSARPRLKRVIVDYGHVLTAVLLLVAVAGGGYIYWEVSHPPVTTVTETTYSDTVRLQTDDEVVLSNATPLYQAGQSLRNMPIYLQSWNDTVVIRIRTILPPGRAGTVNHTFRVTYRATANGGTLYSETQTLAQKTVQPENGVATTTTRLSVTELSRPKERISAAFNGVADVAISLQIVSRYETTAYAGRLNGTLSFGTSEKTFSIGQVTTERTHTATRTRTVTRPRTVGDYLPLAVLSIVAVLGALSVLWIYDRVLDRGRTVDRAVLRDAIHHQRHSDWISAGQRQSEIEYDTELASLEELVDIAIDANRRVIHDQSRNEYSLVLDDVAYLYRPASSGEADTPDQINTGEQPSDNSPS